MHKRNTTITGFTIVELLIVVVVIAILAAITVVAYTNFQQRATNSSIISSANQLLRTIVTYQGLNGEYPVSSDVISCAIPTHSDLCTMGNNDRRLDNAEFKTKLSTISTLPTSVPESPLSHYSGIKFWYKTAHTFNGEPRPLRLYYTLWGSQQQCVLQNVLSSPLDDEAVSSSTGYTSSGNSFTQCVISVPSP